MIGIVVFEVEGLMDVVLRKKKEKETKFYVIKTVHFGMELYNDQHNAQVLIY
jgi:hypothetical protein